MTPDVKVIVIFKTLTLVLLIGGGGAAGCRHLPQEGDTRVDVARDFLTQAADAIRLVGDEGDRGRLIYDLAPDEAKLGDVVPATAAAADDVTVAAGLAGVVAAGVASLCVSSFVRAGTGLLLSRASSNGLSRLA